MESIRMREVLFGLGVKPPQVGGVINKGFDPMEIYEAQIGEKAKNIRRFQISDGLKDRHGARVLVDGWDFSTYKLNPQVQYNHMGNRTDDPDNVIGSGNVLKSGEVVLGDALFDVMGEGPAENQKAKKVLYKLDNGFLSSSSVSIFPVKWRFGNKDLGEDPEEFIFVRHHLLEFSVVAVPANSRANLIGNKSFPDMVKAMEEFLNNQDKDFKKLITSSEDEIEGDHVKIESIKRLIGVRRARLRFLSD